MLVVETFRSFRGELLASYGHIASTHKVDGSLVTVLDKKVENTIKSVLAESFPELSFRGEETGRSGKDNAYWVIDPIDGTTSFIRGTGRCTNMAALMVGGQPIAAVIYDFVQDVLYTARKGEGAWMNGARISVNEHSIAGAFVDNANPVSYDLIARYFAKHGARLFQPTGASGRSLTDVASGRMEGYVVHNTKVLEHDLMPGLFIALEAGAELVPLDSAEPWNSAEPGNYAVVNKKLAEHIRAHQL